MAVRHIPPPGSANKLANITPNDGADNLPANTRGIIVGVGGDIKFTFADGTTAVITGVPAMVLPLCDATRLWATGTTASGFIALADA